MFKITEEIILKKSTELVFHRGKEYYRRDKVKSISFIQEKLLFDAEVIGTEPYQVQIEFGSNGELKYTDCSCPAYEDYWGICKHIVAVLLAIKSKQEQGYFNNLKSKQVSKRIFSYFQNTTAMASIPVMLEISYNFDKASYYASSANSSLSFRIGQRKLYIIKNTKKFFESISKNQPVEFGKGFLFDPSIHKFSERDSQIIELVKELYETEKLMDDFSYVYSKGASLFKDKEVFLPSGTLKRFLDIMEGSNFRANILHNEFENIQIKNGDFPVKFNVNKEGTGIELDIEHDSPLFPLTDEGEYFFSENAIYKPSNKQRESFKPFYMALLQQKGTKIYFYEEDKERFVSEILPFAEKAGDVRIDESLQNIIEKLDLQTEIYLNRSGEGISADVKFIYGDTAINPFSPQDKTIRMDKIIIRDVEKERIILDILGQCNFKVRSNKIFLDEEEEIYEFVFDLIPRLQEICEIFYSDDFKNVLMRQPSSFAGKIRLNRESDMLEVSFNVEGINNHELLDIFQALKEKKKYYRLKNGAFLQLDSQELIEMSDILEYLDVGRKQLESDFIEIPKYRALYLDQHLKDSGLRYFERNQAFKEFVRNVTEPEDVDLPVPDGITGTLREYQKFGFRWLKTMSSYGLGAILADDMGLGKTLQVIALLLSEKNLDGTLPSLVVVPTSLVYNWQVEIERFAPDLKVAIIAGNKEERITQIKNISDYDVIITSYPLIRRDIEEYSNIRFNFCILDEAQHIKNHNSQNAKLVKDINAKNRYALTGTPVENSLDELWSIFDFVLPGYLFSHAKFTEKYIKPIIKDEDKKALGELGRHIRPFVLRRLKSDVLKELPEKIEHKVVAELTEEQKKVYLAYLEQARNDIDKNIKEEGFGKSHIKILAALTRLRQICCHPSVFIENFEGESGKMLLLQEVIQESIEGGHRILLFSQFTAMLGLIRTWLEGQKVNYLYLDGSTKTEDRIKLVKAFNNGQGKIFLISLKAGGTGLNLTGADTVIHYDPWWNPAVEDQATDRAYRIGQKKAVHVMKLITRGTIEEKIYNLQETKKKLIDSVIQPGETMLAKMSEEEIRSLFAD